MSESESGSDLASLRTRAKPVEGGWLLNGSKIWTTNAQVADSIVVLCRTDESDDRHGGLSQLLVSPDLPGVEVRPIEAITGEREFAEVFFDDVMVPGEYLLGEAGQGWKQITAELAFERGGPDRYLSTFPVLEAFVEESSRPFDPEAYGAVGELVSELVALRNLSHGMLRAAGNGGDSGPDAAIAKDAGTEFERRLPEVLRRADTGGCRFGTGRFSEFLRASTLSAPGITLRGGSTEILRGIVGRQLAPRTDS